MIECVWKRLMERGKLGFKILTIALLFALAFWAFFNPKEQGLKIGDLKGLPKLEVLDLVLRAGVDLDSLLIQRLSNSPYSHIGIIIATQPLQVLHASSTDTQNKVAVSKFEYFLAHSKAIAIKRYANLQNKERIVSYLKAQVGKEFKLISGDDALYCTTLIEDALKQALHLNLNYDKLEMSLFSGKYLFPKAFYDDNQSVLIYEFVP